MRWLRFEWDDRKDAANRRKHGVSFQEAQSVFFDERAVQFFDSKHSEWEDRFLLLGWSQQARLLMVCHCLREDEDVIRIISARPATRHEAEYYPGGTG
jgi:hypothetical protein